LSAKDENFTVVWEGAGLELRRLERKLDDLSEAQYGAETATQSFINMTQDLTYSVSGAIGGLETLGYVTYEQSESFRKAETVMQLMLIPYELYNILNSYAIITEKARTASLIAQTKATTTATIATQTFNTALLANPITLAIIAVVALVAALVALQMKFDILNKSLEAAGAVFEVIKDVIGEVVDQIDNLGAKAGVVSNVMKASPIGMALELYGGVR
tara:strand:- start:593 stop:1240 length:648 start_codon:yes stop_codon:yes gene_type:complete